MQFKHLKIVGFKSFADPQALGIEDGLTGIVGPNGCGKSNIVEALRWLMGESSAQNMRGGELEDIIFSGTTNRPPHNFAEVILTLDNSNNTKTESVVPLPQHAEIEISRKLEREKDSTYRINGKVVRAKDVRLLFADIATGARASGIVSQGKVDALINAKPKERRILLEEAASISGLHHRRHEAELRLKGTETNLERLEDVLLQLSEQKGSLQKQARQAARYRSIADRIRKAEAHVLLVRSTIAEGQLAEAEEVMRAAERKNAEAVEKESEAQRLYDSESEALPPLREAEAVSSAEVQRLKLALTEIDNEEERMRKATQDLAARLEQIKQDLARENQLLTDASEVSKRLASETETIARTNEEEEPKRQETSQALEEARGEASTAENELANATALRHAAENEQNTREQHLAELKRQIEIAEKALADTDLDGLKRTLEEAEKTNKTAQTEAAKLTKERSDAEAELKTLQQNLTESLAARNKNNEELGRLTTEAEALKSLLTPQDEKPKSPSLSSQVQIAKGYEEAIAAVLGDELTAPIGKHESIFWASTTTQNHPNTPEGTEPLASHIKAPKVLTAALAGIGMAPDANTAEALQVKLAPGQALTTKQGGLWRWDGYTIPLGQETKAATRLRHETRLREIEASLPSLTAESEKTTRATSDAETALNAAEQKCQQLREGENTALEASRAALSHAEQNRHALNTASARHAEITANLADLTKRLNDAEQQTQSLTDTSGLIEAESKAAANAESKRQLLADAMAAEQSISNARAMRDNRKAEIEREQSLWSERQKGATSRIEELTKRMASAEEEQKVIAKMPEELTAKRESLAASQESAEAKRREASDKLAEAETRLRESANKLREAQNVATETRETIIRGEAQCTLARQHQADIAERIGEKFDTKSESLTALAGLGADDEIDTSDEAMESLEKRYERLLREREDLGAVNLRAEEEMAEIEERAQTLTREREDLEATINKLRLAISELNKEGRERLQKSFAEVDRYFGALFNTLFQGGTAKLSLIEDDDPLEAGLEVFARPPGKNLQSLSLLSGGEKALASIALIFAVFLTNPSPICVLDEVDAPLDDNNVARFCDMLTEIASKTQSRFIVITHHRLTMARMDRLYGVTMEQKGVSRLVSVDLQVAEKFDKSA